ncbi:unnamed protein product [Prunus armeniaca]
MDENRWMVFSQSNAKISKEDGGQISISNGSMTGTNLELQNGSSIVHKWRFGMRLTLEEPKPKLTVMNNTSWMSTMESRLDEQPPLKEKDNCVKEREVHEGERQAKEIERRELERSQFQKN